MAARSIIPVILSGGAGTRLWPLSRDTKPKQFLRFGTDYSLIQETALRCRGGCFDDRPLVVSAESHRFMVAEDLLEIGVSADILLEPMRRDSCAAIVAGALHALARDSEALVLVVAADHRIPDPEHFGAAVASAIPDAEAGHLVTFGIKPREAATGYGYILPGPPLRTGGAAKVERFVEKPDRPTAETYIASGYLWNSGNFLFRADSFIAEAERLAPGVVTAVRGALEAAERDLDFMRLEKTSFAMSPQISVDFAIMEKTEKSAVMAVDYDWSDIGSWEAVWQVMSHDAEGNAAQGKAVILSGGNNLVHAEDRLTGLVGVDDLVVVTTRDAVLVSRRGQTEKVKALVTALKERGYAEADRAQQQFRPWGHTERIDLGGHYRVNRLTVKPGGGLTRQQHHKRAEHWVVVEGAAEVTIGETVHNLVANESVQVPAGAIHRLANRAGVPLVLIEVQTGDYLGEDDVVRLADDSRSHSPAGVERG